MERDWDYEIASVGELISEIKTSHLRVEALRYDVPLPLRSPDIQSDVNWSVGFNSGIISLTSEGRRAVRDAIVREKQSRRDWWAWWIPLAFGLIGSITGLLSTLRH